MSETWGDQNMHGQNGVNGDATPVEDAFAESNGVADMLQEETGRIQEDKINKKKLAELEEDGKMLQIFVRPSKKSGHIPYSGVKNIPFNVATICSNALFDKMKKQGHKYFIIEDSNLAPYNSIFEWIKLCADEKNVANIPEIRELATSEDGIKPILDIILVAEKLKIPTASFNKFMIKKLLPISRDYLIDLDTVSRIFDSGDTEIYSLGLQEIAATSIFSHWYDYKLDAPEFDDYMCQLSDMRDNMPELDAALHKAVDDKNEFLKKKKQERMERQAAEQAGGGWENNNNNSGEAEYSATDTNTYAQDATADAWANEAAAAPVAGRENAGFADTSATAAWATEGAGTGGNWADEVNDNFRPVAAASAGGGW